MIRSRPAALGVRGLGKTGNRQGRDGKTDDRCVDAFRHRRGPERPGTERDRQAQQRIDKERGRTGSDSTNEDIGFSESASGSVAEPAAFDDETAKPAYLKAG